MQNETEKNKMKTAKISEQTAKEMIDSGVESLKKVAYDTYPELKEKELPEKWEDLESIAGFYVSSFSCVRHFLGQPSNPSQKNTLPTIELAEAILALCQLLYLREVYRDGWNQCCDYACVICLRDKDWDTFILKKSDFSNNIFSFKKMSTAEKFLSNFRDLLDKTKPLYE